MFKKPNVEEKKKVVFPNDVCAIAYTLKCLLYIKGLLLRS